MKTQLDRITDQHTNLRHLAQIKLLYATANRFDFENPSPTWAFNLGGMRVTGHAWPAEDGGIYVRAIVNQRGTPDFSRPFHPSDFKHGDAFAVGHIMPTNEVSMYPDEFFCRADCLSRLAKADMHTAKDDR